MIKRIPNRLTERLLPGWTETQVVKPAKATDGLDICLGITAAIDENIIAVGSLAFPEVYVFNISTIPAQQLTILSSSAWSKSHIAVNTVAVNRKHGILIGAPEDDVGSTLEAGF